MRNWLKAAFVAILREAPPEVRLAAIRSALLETLSNEERVFIAREALLVGLEDSDRVHVPGLVRRNSPVTNTWTYQNEHMNWDIRPSEKVLDIGSGGWPFGRATYLVDRYPSSTSHRVEALARDERPFIAADIHQLPFSDKAFDFVFCSHVLEHLENPGKALRELMRIGRRGYIETPSRTSDFMFNFTGIKDHHRWHTLRLGDTLVMIEWLDSERRDTGVNDFFCLLQSRFENAFQKLVEQNWDFFFTQLHWVGRIDFLILDKSGQVIDRNGTTDDGGGR